tara:strand:- start:11563 stop:11958 length:396 start_codon:yes stop_codon:yes gene_type:complete
MNGWSNDDLPLNRSEGRIAGLCSVKVHERQVKAMADFLLSKARKDIVLSKAQLAYLETSKRFITPHLNKPEILRIAVGETKSRLIETNKFNSILGTLALSIALRIAERVIAKWLEENLFSHDAIVTFEKGK